MIDPRVKALCEEVGIEAVQGSAYPRLGQTRAVNTIRRIIDRHGEQHARLVLMTLAETANNKACLDEPCIYATSDLIRIFHDEIERDAGLWMDVWDRLPVGYLQVVSQGVRGYVKQRDALCGLLFERLSRVYKQPDLLEA